MDLPAEFYLQTVKHRGVPVNLSAIRRVGLLTVEGENDDISGIGQTLAAQDSFLVPNLRLQTKRGFSRFVGE
jgi:poly(3-hydroxybutyrate) depolymerase